LPVLKLVVENEKETLLEDASLTGTEDVKKKEPLD
jgi:hypothetical protein